MAKSELRVLEAGAMKDMTTRSAKTQSEIEVTACASGVTVYELLEETTRRDTLRGRNAMVSRYRC
jgi:uncharacterized protein YqkB